MHRLLLICRVNEHSQKLAGVFKKHVGQCKAMADTGYDVYMLYMRYGTQILGRIVDGELEDVHHWEGVTIEGEQSLYWQNAMQVFSYVAPDIIYLRYERMFGEPLLERFLSVAKQNSVNCNIVEFPTWPYAKEIGDKEKIEADAINRRLMLAQVDFTTSTANVETIDNVPNLPFRNKVDVDSTTPAPHAYSPVSLSELIPAICVANLSFWNGFDRVVQGMADAKAKTGSPLLHLHICGDGEDKASLRDRVNRLGLNDCVTFHGFVTGDALTALYHKAWVGIGHIGLHRIDIPQASSLKAREYLLNGLSVVKVGEDMDIDVSEHYFNVPADETPVNVTALVETIRDHNQRYSPVEVQRFARENLGWKHFATELSRAINHFLAGEWL